MNNDCTNLTAEQLKIIVHHVGGIGDFGPVSRLKVFGSDVEWVGYDASEDSIASVKSPSNNLLMVNKCIGKSNGSSTFNIMRESSANSVLPCAPSAENYTWVTLHGRPFVRNGKTMIWGEHTRVVEELNLEINTLDSLVESGEIPQIDVISVDAQGSDYDIMLGASKAFASSVVAVITEIEFAELYAGQALFCDIQHYLRKHHIRFCDFLTTQYFNTNPYPFELQGNGFFTVGEALFLKDAHSLIEDTHAESQAHHDVAQLLKLAAIAVVFDQLDFTLGIIRGLQKRCSLSLEDLAESTGITYIHLLRDLVRAADAVEAKSPALTYDEGRRYGQGPDLPSATPHRSKALIYLFKRLCLRPLRLVIHTKSPIYYGPISKLFHSYGLTQVAIAHERRLIRYLLGMSWPPQNRLFRRFGDKLLGIFYL
jgi:FkbM family methyltransferase